MDYKLFDHLQSPVIVVDDNLSIIYFNFICTTIFKLSPRKLKEFQRIDDLLKVENYHFKSDILDAKNSSTAIITSELEVKINDLHFVFILKFFKVDSGIAIHFQDLSIEKHLHDKYKNQIIELKETHEQIVKSDKLTALGELIAGISHEISSPLTVTSDLLLELNSSLQSSDFNHSQKITNHLIVEFDRIKKIISNMQSLSRDKESNLQIYSLIEIIEKAIVFAKDLSITENIDIDITSIDKKHLVLLNEAKLTQVLINFIKNASDAMSSSPEKKIIFQSSELGSQVVLDIFDSGPGVKEPSKIFEMFYTTKDIGEGTGLGLPISQKIIQSFHGSIDYFDSTKKGFGTHFQIKLPIIESESFAITNRYLTGECEYEDLKVLLYSSDSNILNQVFQKFRDQNIILILTTNPDQIEDLNDSYFVDYIIVPESLKSIDSFDAEIKVLAREEDISEALTKLIAEERDHE